MSQQLCFNASTSRVCVTFTPTNASQGIVTQGFFSDIGNAFESAADTISSYLPSRETVEEGLGYLEAAEQTLTPGMRESNMLAQMTQSQLEQSLGLGFRVANTINDIGEAVEGLGEFFL